jgi:hypothetical protein
VLTPLGRVVLAGPAYAVCAAPAWGTRVFAVALDSGCVLVDAGEGAPRIVMRWPFRGLRGALPTRQGLLAWGEAGVWRIDAGSPTAPRCSGEHRAVRAAAAAGRWMALLYGDDLVLGNDHGGEVARVALPGVLAVGFAGASLVTATALEVRAHRVSHAGRLEPGEQLLDWGTPTLRSSPATGSLFAHHAEGRWFEIGPDGQPGASYAELPWAAHTAMAGPVWARIGAGAVLETYRAGPLVQVVPPGEGAASTSTA